jgi:hypothetical protein
MEHYKRQGQEFEIDSELDGVCYCLKHGKLSIFCEEEGDVVLPAIGFSELQRFIDELQEIYEVYVKDVHLMNYLKEEEE